MGFTQIWSNFSVIMCSVCQNHKIHIPELHSKPQYSIEDFLNDIRAENESITSLFASLGMLMTYS